MLSWFSVKWRVGVFGKLGPLVRYFRILRTNLHGFLLRDNNKGARLTKQILSHGELDAF